MDIDIHCYKCGDGLEIVRKQTDWGGIRIAVEPCPCVIEAAIKALIREQERIFGQFMVWPED